MKFYIKKLFVLFALLFSVQCFKAQVMQDSIPVIISLTDDTQIKINTIKNQLQMLPSSKYLGFCNNHKLFLLYIDPFIHGSSTLFLSNLIKATGLYDLSLKEGSVTDIIGFCEFKDSSEYDANKKQSK